MPKILVIDDEEQIRVMILAALRQKKFEVFEAQDGRAGVKLAQSLLPDLIVCDVRMDDLDGYGTLAALRSEPATAAIPFILMTGMADPKGMRQGMQLGADDYLPKPFTVPELLATIEARLRKQQAVQQQAQQQLSELRANLSLTLPHELMTPLTGILGLSEIISTEYADVGQKEVVQMARDIHQAAQRLHRLIKNCLIYAQIELLTTDSPKVAQLRKQRTPNTALPIGTVARQRAEHAGRAADLLLELAPVPAAISEEYLTKIVEELLDNAFKFSTSGSPINIVTAAAAGDFTLTIADRGRGMAPDQISRVGAYMQFQRRFYEQQGSGLGLVIAKRLAELHGGSLDVQSEAGKGTTVHLFLPQTPQS